MKDEKKYKGVYEYEHKGVIKYMVITTFRTKDKYELKKTKRGFDTAKKANTWKEQERARISELTRDEIETGKCGYEACFQKYLEYKSMTCKPSSLVSIKTFITKYFNPFIDTTKGVDKITVKDLERFYTNLANSNIKASSKNICKIIVLDFLNYLDLTEMISSSILKKAKLIFVQFKENEKKSSRYIEHEDIRTLLDYYECFNDLRHKTLHLVIDLLVTTGSRCSETLGLRYDDLKIEYDENNEPIYKLHFERQALPSNEFESINKINEYHFENAYISNSTKTYAVKDVIIPEWLAEEILEHKNINKFGKYGFIFNIEKNKMLTREVVYRAVHKACAKIGIDAFKIHDLRTTMITDLYEMGCSPIYVRDRVGHSSEDTSKNIYQKISQERKQRNDEIVKSYKI